MKDLCKFIVLLLISSIAFSCFEDIDDNPATAKDLNNFVWRGLNTYYLYKDFVPDLENDRFSSDLEYNTYLNGFSSPEDLFENLIYQRETTDRFSWITDDYIALEQLFSGITLNNGMEFGLFRFQDTDTNIYGYVRYVLPNTDAEIKGVQRGYLFSEVNGTQLTINNWRTLLSPSTYNISLGAYNDNGTPEPEDDSISLNGESITLTKAAYTENPIFKTEILQVEGENVGYLMYNGFTRDFDTQLNAVFGNFLANNVQHLVLDLRYNPGGSVNTAILLSSMVSGNVGEVFSTEQWNSDIQALFEPEDLINRFVNNDDGVALNILNLQTVYVLTTRGSASASELVINALNPYIDVIQIGTKTTGKYQASITLYDSPDFRRTNANTSHTYAMQPLVLKSLNADGFTDYDDGLVPDILQSENYGDLGVLGNENEPLLATALQHIADNNRMSTQTFEPLELISDSKDFSPFSNGMYIDKELPLEFLNR